VGTHRKCENSSIKTTEWIQYPHIIEGTGIVDSVEVNSLLVIQFNFFLPTHSKASSRLSNRERGKVAAS